MEQYMRWPSATRWGQKDSWMFRLSAAKRPKKESLKLGHDLGFEPGICDLRKAN
jgi:hypothetical protein